MDVYLFRSYVFGEEKAGKTSILKRLHEDTFSQEMEVT